jgi:alpha-aminoadipate carrier protein LysW
MVTCPLCDSEIDLEEDELDEGDLLSCDECGAELLVAGLDPVEVEPVEEEDEDLDTDEDEEDDHRG